MKYSALTLALCAITAAVVSSVPASAGGPPRFVIGPGNERHFQDLLGRGPDRIRGLSIISIKIVEDRVEYDLSIGGKAFSLTLRHPSFGGGGYATTNFSLEFGPSVPGGPKGGFAEMVAGKINSADKKSIWIDTRSPAYSSEGRTPQGVVFKPLEGRFPADAAALVLLALFTAACLIPKSGKAIASGFDSAGAVAGRAFIPAAAAVVAYAAFLRLHLLDMPLNEGGSIARLLYTGQAPLGNLLMSADSRRPGFYFAVMHLPLVLSGYSVYAVRVAGVIVSLVSIPLFGLIIRRNAGALVAFAGMLALAVWPEHIRLSREISDAGLFTTLGLAACLYYMRSIETAGKLDGALFALFMGLALLSSFSAALIFLPLAIHGLIDGERRKKLLLPLIAAFAVALPAVFRLAVSMPDELADKAASILSPGLVWGGGGPGEIAAGMSRTLFTFTLGYSAVAAFAIWLWACRGRVRRALATGSLLIAHALFPPAAAFLRIKPYYAIFFTPALLMFMSDITGNSRRSSREVKMPSGNGGGTLSAAMPTAALFLLAVSFSFDMKVLSPGIYHPQEDAETGTGTMITQVKKDGGSTIVQDFDRDLFLTAWRFFEKPYASVNGYFREPPENPKISDAGSPKEAIGLQRTGRLTEGWEALAVEKLKGILAEKPAHVLMNHTVKNGPLTEFLGQKCAGRLKNSRYTLYKCPGGPDM